MLARAPSRSRPTSAPASRSARDSFNVSMQNSAAANAVVAMRRRHRRPRPRARRASSSPTRCNERDPLDVGPAAPELRRRSRPSTRRARALRRPRTSSRATSVAALGVIAHDAEEASRRHPRRASSPTACSASTGSAVVGERDPVARVGRGPEHGERVYGTSSQRPPGRPDPTTAAAVAERESASLHSIAMGRGRDRASAATSTTTRAPTIPRRRRSRVGRSASDPLDRLWLHPSELSPLTAPSPRPPRRTTDCWTTHAASAGAAGAILTLAVLGAVGAIGGSSDGTRPRRTCPRARRSRRPQRRRRSRSPTRSWRCSVHDKSARDAARACASATPARSSPATGSSAPPTQGRRHDRRRLVHTARVVGRDATTDLVLLVARRPTDGADHRRPADPTRRPHVLAARAGRHRVGRRRTEPRRHFAVGEQRARRVHRQLVPSRAARPRAACSRPTAASSPASSGGALVDHSGDVTGIVLAPVGDDRMTYAVPIATALVDRRRSSGTRVRDARRARASTASNGTDGPTITSVLAGGPAAARRHARRRHRSSPSTSHEVDSMGDVMAVVRHIDPGSRSRSSSSGAPTHAAMLRATLTSMIP